MTGPERPVAQFSGRLGIDPVDNRRDIPAFLDALNDARFDRQVPPRVPSGLPVGGAIAPPR
jgi:hypothetical protein